MRAIAALIALAGVAGLVGLIVPLGEIGSLLPFVFEHQPIKGVLLLAGFGLGLGLGGFAMAKERMSKLHAIATLVGFAAAGVALEIWEIVEALTQGGHLAIAFVVMAGAVVLGVIASIAGMIKGRAAD